MRYWIFIGVVLLGLGSGEIALWANESLPVAAPVSIEGATPPPGTVIAYDDVADVYRVAREDARHDVYGVTTNQPVITMVDDTDAVPVITRGVVGVRVVADAAVERGDVLTLAAESGVARPATLEEPGVFAVALENRLSAATSTLVLASVGPVYAESWQRTQQALAAHATGTNTAAGDESEPRSVSSTRVAIAVAIAIVALGFGLFAFRAILVRGMTAVGRNPRARGAVLAMTIGSMVLVVALAALALLVAVAVLVLPV
jgi:F0F1-type ATP synthase membrane subunit c/vacuolar-type H+-ATPase subunit K